MSVKRLLASGVVLCCVLGVVCSQAVADGDDWPQWRGPGRDGIVSKVELPRTWPEQLKVLWKLEVGEGHSSPVVVSGRVVLMARQGEDEVIQCLDADRGKELWRNKYAVAYTPSGAAKPHGKGPKSTVTIADGKVYAFGITGVLSCLELDDGKLVWRKDFSGEYRKTWPAYGAANSPLIEGKLCILGVGGSGDGGIVAFDRETGAVLWKGGDEGPSYSSPVVAELPGGRQVVALTQTRLVGLALKDGKVLWEVPFKTSYDMNTVTPLVHKNLVVFGGYKKPALGVRLVRDGAGVKVEQAWTNVELQMYMSSPVLKDGHLYGLTQRRGGRLMCAALADGKTVWESPERLGQYVSLILVGDRMLVLDTRGILRVVAADPAGHKEVARVRVSDSPVWAHLALCDGRLYVKDRTALTCYELIAK